jgi:hypothetical protein
LPSPLSLLKALVKQGRVSPGVLDRLIEGELKAMHHGTTMKFKNFDPDIPVYLARDPEVAYRASSAAPSNQSPKGAERGPPRVITTLPNPKNPLQRNWDGSTAELNEIMAQALRDKNDYIDIPRARDIWIRDDPNYAISLDPRNLIPLGEHVVSKDAFLNPRKFLDEFND